MPIYQNVLRNKLHQELVDGGIDPNKITIMAIDDTEIGANLTIAEDVDLSLVERIINAHDPSPITPNPDENEILRDYILDVDYRLILLEQGL